MTTGSLPGFDSLLPAAMAVAEVPLPAARDQQFGTGRHCAQLALARLVGASSTVPKAPTGEPRWPPGVVGSITHGAGTCAAVVGRRGAPVIAVGIDAAEHRPLSGRVARRVLAGEDLPVGAAAAGVAWDAVVFSAKEAAFKAWFPLTRRPLRFADVCVQLDAPGDGSSSGTFGLRFHREVARHVGGLTWHGRFAVEGPTVRTVMTVRSA